MLYSNRVYRGTTHPATDDPPLMVFPDTPEAQIDVAMKKPAVRDLIGFCQHFVADPNPIAADGFREVAIPCRNRNTQAAPKYNWCFRCMAGFPVRTQRLT